MRSYGQGRTLEYNMVIATGIDPAIVTLAYEWIKRLRARDDGGLKIRLKDRALLQKRPYVYQETDGRRVE